MKIGRYQAADGERIGVVVEGRMGARALDVMKAAVAKGSKPPFATLKEVIASGKPALDQLNSVVEWAAREGEDVWFANVDSVRWLAPVAPQSFLCAGRNFGGHLDESVAFWTTQGISVHSDIPSGFIKLPQVIVPHKAEVAIPSYVKEFDYEVEVAAVIGKATGDVSVDNALDHVFGYTVLNDLSAREWQRKEMQNQMIITGKNFPGAAPLGPWILTADEAGDPAGFTVELSVNGRTLQKAPCTQMVFSFAQLIAFWSRVGLVPGDLIASGTPEGVAMHRKPDPFEFYLKPGDVVHASVDKIGTLETKIC